MILKSFIFVFVIIAVECNESVYTERSGEIVSADFPKPYPKSSDCTYRIELEEGFQITLEFDDTFDIEDHPEVTCPYDFIKVRTFFKRGHDMRSQICLDLSTYKRSLYHPESFID